MNLTLNQAIRVRDLTVDAKWKPVSEGDTMIAHVVMPKAEQSAEATAAEGAAAAPAGAEPEVIKKGKEEKDEKK